MRINVVLPLLIMASILSNVTFAADSDEVTLFNAAGRAEAYIAVDDEMTVYLWSGEPAAYLLMSEGGHDVYGFNGAHLGWFVHGVIWNHKGDGVCVVKEVLGATDFEPFKQFKELRPFKSSIQSAPLKPPLSGRFSEIPCRVHLSRGID